MVRRRRPPDRVQEITVDGRTHAAAGPAPQDADPVEDAYRRLADHTSDVVVEVTLDGTIRWVSPSVTRVLGHDPDALVGASGEILWHPGEDEVRERVRTALHAGRRTDDVECRLHTRDGEWRWMTAHVEPVLDDRGRLVGAIVGYRDTHGAVVADRARRTLSAGNAILVRAEHEDELLRDMCQAAVDAGGYRFAWYSRPVGEPGRPVRAVATSADDGGYRDVIESTYGTDPLGRGPVGRALRTGVVARVDNLLTDPLCRPWREALRDRGFGSAIAVPVYVDGALDGAFVVYAAEPYAFDAAATDVLEDVAAQLGIGVRRLRETRRLSAAMEAQSVLLAAIDQADEAVIVSDPSPRILYANAAAARWLGWSIADLVGHDPRDLSFDTNPAVAEGLEHDVVEGRPWRGVIQSAGPDGTPLLADGTVTPVVGSAGEVVAYVTVMRDVTDERARDEAIDREHRDREAVLGIYEHVRPEGTVEETASEFCAWVETIPGFDAAMVMMYQPDGSLMTYASGRTTAGEFERGAPIAIGQLHEVVRRTREGPWLLDLADGGSAALLGPVLLGTIRRLGAGATAYAPIRWGGEPSGVLAVIAGGSEGPAELAERLGILGELGAFAGLLFGAQAEQFSERESRRREIQAIIDAAAFHPVFQPIVDIETGEIRGYEALTRFADGVRPERRFARAHEVGLGSELERVCAVAAMEAADAHLADDVWLTLNFSPACVLDGTACAVVDGARRPVVVEITEHAQIRSYPELRAAFARCQVLVAVDDAGAGFASLRHILELRPDIVKLDIGLVRDIDVDDARQAMAAGLCEFAMQTGTTLIAEGVETETEAEAVRRLGVRFAQGFRFGRPGPLPSASVGTDER